MACCQAPSPNLNQRWRIQSKVIRSHVHIPVKSYSKLKIPLSRNHVKTSLFKTETIFVRPLGINLMRHMCILQCNSLHMTVLR